MKTLIYSPYYKIKTLRTESRTYGGDGLRSDGVHEVDGAPVQDEGVDIPTPRQPAADPPLLAPGQQLTGHSRSL